MAFGIDDAIGIGSALVGGIGGLFGGKGGGAPGGSYKRKNYHEGAAQDLLMGQVLRNLDFMGDPMGRAMMVRGRGKNQNNIAGPFGVGPNDLFTIASGVDVPRTSFMPSTGFMPSSGVNEDINGMVFSHQYPFDKKSAYLKSMKDKYKDTMFGQVGGF